MFFVKEPMRSHEGQFPFGIRVYIHRDGNLLSEEEALQLCVELEKKYEEDPMDFDGLPEISEGPAPEPRSHDLWDQVRVAYVD